MSRGGVSPLTVVLVAVLVIAVFSVETVAFGAGNIPSYGYLEGKAFRVDPSACLHSLVIPFYRHGWISLSAVDGCCFVEACACVRLGR